MRHLLFILALSACSVGTTDTGDAGIDPTLAVGLWTGTSTVTVSGVPATTTVQIPITNAGNNLVSLNQICPDFATGGTAILASPTSFALVPFNCPPSTIGSCASAALSFASGTGTITPADAGTTATLSFTGAGTAAGCGTSAPVAITFTGTKS